MVGSSAKSSLGSQASALRSPHAASCRQRTGEIPFFRSGQPHKAEDLIYAPVHLCLTRVFLMKVKYFRDLLSDSHTGFKLVMGSWNITDMTSPHEPAPASLARDINAVKVMLPVIVRRAQGVDA